MAYQKSATRGTPVTLQPALTTTGNGTVIAIPDSFTRHRIIIKGSAGIASGAIQPESADDPTYAGTWGQIGGGPITAVASTEITVDFTGVYSFIRARVSTDIVGGTVTVTYEGS